MWEAKINVYDPDINYSDVYLLNYFGILVFFSVCYVSEETVRVVELDTYSYKNGIMVYKDLRLSKNPYFVTKNIRSKSDYEITLEENMEGYLPIDIAYGCKLYNEVLYKGKEIPISGRFYAEKIKEYKNQYFIIEKEEESIKA